MRAFDVSYLRLVKRILALASENRALKKEVAALKSRLPPDYSDRAVSGRLVIDGIDVGALRGFYKGK